MSDRMSLDHLISWAMQGGPAPVELTDASVERITLASEHLRMAHVRQLEEAHLHLTPARRR